MNHSRSTQSAVNNRSANIQNIKKHTRKLTRNSERKKTQSTFNLKKYSKTTKRSRPVLSGSKVTRKKKYTRYVFVK